MSQRPSLANRIVAALGWNASANLVQTLVGFGRSVLLARLLPVEAFGVYAWAGAWVSLSATLFGFGIGEAFLHRAPETQDEEAAAAIHFTLRLILTLVWVVLLVVVALLFFSAENRLALLWLTGTHGLLYLTSTSQMILARRVVHRRLALLQISNTLLLTLVALGLAWRGAGLWALLATDAVTLVVTVGLLHVWRPVWRPRLAWSAEKVRYFLRFGSRNLVAGLLSRALNEVDDLWAGAFLGQTPLSFYSRAFRFATYPRSILAAPLNVVARGAYAELKGDRLRLSRAFFRINALLLRSGFFLGGLLALVAPEFVRLLLGAKWMPMLEAFRLMLLFTLLDPIKVTISSLFVAVGRPEQLIRANFIQLLVLIIGLFLLGPWWGIAGVALAVDAMLVVGIWTLLWQARMFVDFSWMRLFVMPSLALAAGMLSGRVAILLPGVLGSDWRTGGVKVAVFALVYGGVLFVLERREVLDMLLVLRRLGLGRGLHPDSWRI